MRNTILENKANDELFAAYNYFRNRVQDYLIFPIYILLKRLDKDFEIVEEDQRKKSKNALSAYRLHCSNLAKINPELSEALKYLEDCVEKHNYFGEAIYWPDFFKRFNFNEMTQEEFEVYFEQSVLLAKKIDIHSDFSTPKEIAEFMTSVYTLKPNATVFNPFAGNASLSNYLPHGITYAANEINKRSWAVGILNLAVHNRLKKSDFICKDAFFDSRRDQTFDFVISNPPFGLKQVEQDGFTPSEADGDTICRAMKQIQPNGYAAVIATPNFLFNNKQISKSLRKTLIEHDILEYVVLLPAKLFQNTSIACVAIFLNSNPDKRGGVTFIDASDFVLAGKKDTTLDTERLLELIKEGGDTLRKKWVSNNEIEKEEYNFSVRRYLFIEETPVNVNVVTLNQITEIRSKIGRIETGTIGKFVRIRDLRNGLLDRFLKLEPLEIVEIPAHAYEIKAASLLLALKLNSLKPTAINFTNSNTPIFVSNDILTLKVNDDLVDINYLISELQSDYVLKQVTSYQSGSTILSISRQDILKLKIRLPNKENQLKIFNERLEAIYLEKDKELRDFKESNNIQVETYKGIASFNHSLGRPLLNVGSGVLTIEALLAKTTDQNLKKDLEKVLADIHVNMALVNNLIESNENEVNLQAQELEEVELIDFIKKYISSSTNFSFKQILVIANEITNELANSITIRANKVLLSVLFNDILDNAERHAFKGQEHDVNEMVISIDLDTTEETSKVILSFKNNGLPFPENFGKDKFIRKNSKAGETGNTGTGGHDIDRIISFLQGTFDLRLHEDDRYPTNYLIELPIIITK